MSHTQACLTNQTIVAAERFAYAQRWPNHCPDCEGWGGHLGSYDPSPAGVSLGSGSFTEFDPCESCYCKGACPRCGASMGDGQELFDNDTPCLSCGFKEGDEGMASQQECACWYDEERAMLEQMDLYQCTETFWIFDNTGCPVSVADEQLSFAAEVPDDFGDYASAVDAAFAVACQNAGLETTNHNYAIAA